MSHKNANTLPNTRSRHCFVLFRFVLFFTFLHQANFVASVCFVSFQLVLFRFLFISFSFASGEFRCVCQPNFVGRYCEATVDPCAADDEHSSSSSTSSSSSSSSSSSPERGRCNGGRCVADATSPVGFRCEECLKGYTGSESNASVTL